jgi:multiple sugar transport system ATP-binding protein
MAELRLVNVCKSFGITEVIREVDLTIADGEFCVFLGPSGCGKSTLLRLIAGLEEVTCGTIYIGGQDATRLPPKQRQVAMVFQSYALYPHMSAFENMAFGLKRPRNKRSEVKRRVQEVAKILHIEHLLARRPAELSGGQRQRVAIGRAIVREPGVFLLDEPLSNLDADLRARMRLEFTKLHRRLEATMVYVTHDQVEAMTLAEKMVVLQAGRIAQVGPPLTLYRQPKNLFVAGFIGSPRMNFLPGRLAQITTSWATVTFQGGCELRADVQATRTEVGTPVTLGIRPEHVSLQQGENNTFSAQVNTVEHLGDQDLLYVTWEATPEPFVVRTDGTPLLTPGERVQLTIPTHACHLFDANGVAFENVSG